MATVWIPEKTLASLIQNNNSHRTEYIIYFQWNGLHVIKLVSYIARTWFAWGCEPLKNTFFFSSQHLTELERWKFQMSAHRTPLKSIVAYSPELLLLFRKRCMNEYVSVLARKWGRSFRSYFIVVAEQIYSFSPKRNMNTCAECVIAWQTWKVFLFYRNLWTSASAEEIRFHGQI